MIRTIIMLSDSWCEAVESEAFEGPLSRQVTRRGLPAGVDPSDARVSEDLKQCFQAAHRLRRIGTTALARYCLAEALVRIAGYLSEPAGVQQVDDHPHRLEGEL